MTKKQKINVPAFVAVSIIVLIVSAVVFGVHDLLIKIMEGILFAYVICTVVYISAKLTGKLE